MGNAISTMCPSSINLSPLKCFLGMSLAVNRTHLQLLSILYPILGNESSRGPGYSHLWTNSHLRTRRKTHHQITTKITTTFPFSVVVSFFNLLIYLTQSDMKRTAAVALENIILKLTSFGRKK